MNKFSELRKKAEAILLSTASSSSSTTNQTIDGIKVLHELDTYQIELELQNKELQESNRKFAEEVETHHRHYEVAPVGYVTLSEKGSVLELNQTLASMLGVAKDLLLESVFTDLIFDDDQDVFYFYRQSLTEMNEPHSCELRLTKKNAEPFWVKLDCRPEQHDATFYIAISDIPLLKKQEKDLQLAASVFNECSEAIVVTDAARNIIKVNAAFTTITEYSEKEALGKNPKILQSGKHDRAFYRAMWSALHEHQHWQGEIWSRRKSGEIYPEWLSITSIHNAKHKVTHYIGMFSDITLRKSSEAHIHFMAYYDALTQLPSRTLVGDRLKQALALSHRNNTHGALLMLDLDRFKMINDSLGHLVGDKVLQETAKRLIACVREQDTAARLGGDEFVVLLPGLSRDKRNASIQAGNVAQKIIKELGELITIDEHKLQVGVSIGIAMYPSDTNQLENLIQLADNAMYKVKGSGRNHYHYYTASMQEEANTRLSMQNDLHQAIEKQEFELFYQPQINIETNRICGAEALIRWNHPEKGLVLPLDFISVAEDTGLIIPIGTWVIEQACQALSTWNEFTNTPIEYLAVNVNVSSRQFQQKNFVSEMERILAKSSINLRQLELELTESVLIHDISETLEKLNTLKGIGVLLAIDDFGTGYSSLQYLKRLPIDVLKIDQSFIRDMNIDPTDEAIVRTAITLAKNLKMRVLAQGVENQQQLDFLKQNGCHNYQGYHCSKPVNASDFIQLLKNKSISS